MNYSRISRKLIAIEGYLDLGMAAAAARELNALGDVGDLEGLRQFLHGEVLRMEKRYRAAIRPFQRAARMIPSPHNAIVWQSLGACYRGLGLETLADAIESFAELAVQRLRNSALEDDPFPVEDDEDEEWSGELFDSDSE